MCVLKYIYFWFFWKPGRSPKFAENPFSSQSTGLDIWPQSTGLDICRWGPHITPKIGAITHLPLLKPSTNTIYEATSSTHYYAFCEEILSFVWLYIFPNEIFQYLFWGALGWSSLGPFGSDIVASLVLVIHITLFRHLLDSLSAHFLVAPMPVKPWYVGIVSNALC